MVIVIRQDHVVYRHRSMNALECQKVHEAVRWRPVVVQGSAVVVYPQITTKVVVVVVVAVDEEDNIQIGRLVVHVDRYIMGMVRAEGNNIIHRKVCSTSQCDLNKAKIK